jgi:DNA-binding response OmpR family regulator
MRQTMQSPDPETVTLHVPFRVVKRGGRKERRLPEGAIQSRGTDNTLVKALARAFRWKRMLESGEFATIRELAEREELTLLAALASHPGKVLTHTHLLREVWGPAHIEHVEYLRVTVRALRKKLEDDPASPMLIQNEPGLGYRLKEMATGSST